MRYRMKLTPQEKMTLYYIILGYSDKEIAQKMNIKYCTVRTYLDRGVLKMAARNKIHAAFKYILTLSPEVYLQTIRELEEVL